MRPDSVCAVRVSTSLRRGIVRSIDGEIRALFPPDVNGFRVITDFASLSALCNPHSGSRPPGDQDVAVQRERPFEKTPT